MKILTGLILLLLLASCSQPNASQIPSSLTYYQPVSTGAIDTTEFHVLVADIPNGFDSNCKLEFAEMNNTLAFKVNVLGDGDGFGYACDVNSASFIPVEMFTRDENSEMARFLDGGIQPYQPREVMRPLSEFRVFGLKRKDITAFDSAVMLVPRTVDVTTMSDSWAGFWTPESLSTQGCYFGHNGECVGEH